MDVASKLLNSYIFMESSDSSVKMTLDLPTQRWARIVGIAIAVLTLAIPTFAIAYYSSDYTPDYSSLNPKNSILPTLNLPTSSQSRFSV
jgi:hypothetical protein